MQLQVLHVSWCCRLQHLPDMLSLTMQVLAHTVVPSFQAEVGSSKQYIYVISAAAAAPMQRQVQESITPAAAEAAKRQGSGDALDVAIIASVLIPVIAWGAMRWPTGRLHARVLHCAPATTTQQQRGALNGCCRRTCEALLRLPSAWPRHHDCRLPAAEQQADKLTAASKRVIVAAAMYMSTQPADHEPACIAHCANSRLLLCHEQHAAGQQQSERCRSSVAKGATSASSCHSLFSDLTSQLRTSC